jgi:hypothetical protein
MDAMDRPAEPPPVGVGRSCVPLIALLLPPAVVNPSSSSWTTMDPGRPASISTCRLASLVRHPSMTTAVTLLMIWFRVVTTGHTLFFFSFLFFLEGEVVGVGVSCARLSGHACVARVCSWVVAWWLHDCTACPTQLTDRHFTYIFPVVSQFCSHHLGKLARPLIWPGLSIYASIYHLFSIYRRITLLLILKLIIPV